MRPKAGSDSIPEVGCSPCGFYQTCNSIQVSAAELPTKPPMPARVRRRNCAPAIRPAAAASRKALPSMGFAENVHRRRAGVRRRARPDLPACGRAGLLPLRGAQGAVVIGCRSAASNAAESCFQSCSSSLAAVSGFRSRRCRRGCEMRRWRRACFVGLQAIFRVAVFVGHEGIDQPGERPAALRNAHLRPFDRRRTRRWWRRETPRRRADRSDIGRCRHSERRAWRRCRSDRSHHERERPR